MLLTEALKSSSGDPGSSCQICVTYVVTERGTYGVFVLVGEHQIIVVAQWQGCTSSSPQAHKAPFPQH